MEPFKKASTLELLIELMYEGKSGLIDTLKDEEPISVPVLLGILRVRAGRDVGSTFMDWYEWFENSCVEATPEEKDILENLYEFKKKTDKLVRRIKRNQGDA